jgi:HAE1 family hydrophobic/amphiphilic exporter-1
MFSKFFISRPIFACVISIVTVLLGMVSYWQLPVAQYPELAPPIVRVEARYPGANARNIADTVAAPVEQEVNGVDDMIYMNSVSSDGLYTLDISFKPGTDVDLAAVLVQNRVSIAQPRLPEEVRRQGITTRKQSTTLAGVVSLSSPDGSVNDVELSNFITLYWRDEFARIPGVGAINIIPAKDYGMRIWIDPFKLKARGLTVNDLMNAVREQNVQVAAGAIGRQPAPLGTELELAVTAKGRLTQPEEFGAIIVKADGNQFVRVSDVARVELGARDYSTSATFNSNPNAVMAIYQLPGANLVEIADAVTAKLSELSSPNAPVALPPGTRAKLFYDSSMFIEASMDEVVVTLVEAFVLVFLVVLVFLQSLRTTLITALTIPVSLIGTFLLLLAFGFSINMLTMFGLVLAIGIVVDDAIIVVENVERNMTVEGLGAREATIKAMGEITGPIVAVTLVLMSVFLPSAALPGITGEMYRQFALTIAASTALSAVNALTLSPALCAIFLKVHTPHKAGGKKPFILLRPLSFAASLFNRGFDRVTSVYAWIVEKMVRLAAVSMLVFAGVLAVTFVLFTRIPAGFVPGEDLGFVVVAAQLPDGASLERSENVINRVSTAVQKVEGVEDVVTLAGFSVIQGQGSTYANAWIVLKPWEERYKGDSPRSIEAIIAEINKEVQGIQEAQCLVFSLPAIQGLGNTSGFDLRVRDAARRGRGALQQATEELVGAAFGNPSTILWANSSYRAAVPQLFIDVDREKVQRLNIPLQNVFDTLQASLGSAYVNDFNLLGRTFQVNLQADAQFRLKPEDITRLEVRSRTGEMIPLSTIAVVRESLGPDRIERYNMEESAQVIGAPAFGASSGDAMATMMGLAQSRLAEQGMNAQWSTMSYQEDIAAKGLGVPWNGGVINISFSTIAFGLALVLVYLILAAQYESWMTPLAVVLSIPLVVIGAAIAVTYRGIDNNVFTGIGLVLLIGLGAKNAILIVEFARENRARGETLVKSAVEAARTRLRPILMTSFAFILGVVPLLTATGAGAASRRTLGTAVFGGMVGVTLLGIFFVPVLYVAVTWIAEKFTPRRASVQGHHEEDSTKSRPSRD